METEEAAPAPAEETPVVEEQATEAEAETPDSEEPKDPPRRSRREALEQAFAKLDQEDEPEEGESEEAGVKAEQPRAPDGKFAPKEKEAAEEQPKEQPSQHRDPPSHFSADAKAEWEKAPESVRAEAHRAIREMEQGIQQYKQRVEPLDPFFKMAEQHGVKLEDAIGRYVNMENMLRQDPARGFQEIARNMGIDPRQVGQALLGQQQGQQGDPRDQHISRLEQKIAQLEQGYGQVSQTMEQQREAQTMQQVEAFAAEHPRFDELSETIAELLNTGFAKDLADAYEKAERLNPAPAPQPEPAAPEPPAQTRQAKSVTGAPRPGSNPANRQPSKTRTEAIQRAMSRAGL